jgi:transposase
MYTREKGGILQAKTKQGTATLQVHLVGAHPILMHFLARMSFVRIVRSCLPARPSGILDHAQTLAILVGNILLSPAPLYRIAEWVEPIDPEALGLSASQKEAINDDRIARTLDALISVPARNLFFRLALRIIKDFQLDTARVHHDTTTVTFHGGYTASVKEPHITYGMNKDHRPDLKQLVFGLTVLADGAVPISHEVYSGNRTDDTVHRGNLDYLRQLLGREDFVYVADSKLCTRQNLSHIASFGGKFVTLLPRTRAEDKLFRLRIRQGSHPRWYRLLSAPNKRRSTDPPDVYSTTSEGPAFTSEGYRLIWCRSSQKAALDSRVREAELKKAETELFDLGTRLNRGRLRSRAEIKKAVAAIMRKYLCRQFLTVNIGYRLQTRTKRLSPGRPKKGAPRRIVRHRLFHLDVRRNKESLRAEARTDGIFPLVTNLHSSEASKKKVLLIYKYQPYIEKRHSLLKSELEVAPVYLKKPSRAAGLIHAAYIAMTLDALIERTLRRNMARLGIESLPILPEGRHTKTPTTARLLEMFSGVSWYGFEGEGGPVTFPIHLTSLQKKLLELLDMDKSAYS